MLHYIYERYGGAWRRRGGSLKFLHFPFFTRWVAEKLAFTAVSVGVSFFRETGAEWALSGFAESIAGRTGNIVELLS